LQQRTCRFGACKSLSVRSSGIVPIFYDVFRASTRELEKRILTNFIERIAQEQDRDLILARLNSLAGAEARAADDLNEQLKRAFESLRAQATLTADIDKNVSAVRSEL
jgi:hypothetical protein